MSSAPGEEVFAPARRQPSGNGRTGRTALILTLGGIPAAGGTPTAASADPRVSGRLTSLYRKDLRHPRDGRLTQLHSSAVCSSSQCTINIENYPAVPPGGPNCCDDPDVGSALDCLDEDRRSPP